MTTTSAEPMATDCRQMCFDWLLSQGYAPGGVASVGLSAPRGVDQPLWLVIGRYLARPDGSFSKFLAVPLAGGLEIALETVWSPLRHADGRQATMGEIHAWSESYGILGGRISQLTFDREGLWAGVAKVVHYALNEPFAETETLVPLDGFPTWPARL